MTKLLKKGDIDIQQCIKEKLNNKVDEYLQEKFLTISDLDCITANKYDYKYKGISTRDHLIKKNFYHIDPTISDSQIIDLYKKDPEFYIKILENKKNFCLTIELLEKIVSSTNYYSKGHPQKILDFIINEKIQTDENAFNFLINMSDKIDENQVLNIYKKHDWNYDQKTLLAVITKKLHKCIEYFVFQKNIKFNNLCFDAYINTQKEKNNNYDKLFGDFKFTSEHLNKAIVAKNIPIFEYLIKNKKILMDEKCFYNYIGLEYTKEYTDNEYNDMFKNIEFDTYHLEKTISFNNNNIMKYLINFKKIKINDNCVKLFVENLDDKIDLNIYNFILNNNDVKFNTHHLSLAIKHKKFDLIKFLINKKKIKCDESCIIYYYSNFEHYNNKKEIYDLIFENVDFTHKCLELACEKLHVNAIMDILNQRSFALNFDLYLDILLIKSNVEKSDTINKILLAFFSFGNKLSEDYIIKFLNRSINLDENLIKDYKVTEKFSTTCIHPEYYNTGCRDIYWLRKLCNGSITLKVLDEIKKFINKEKIYPDYECFKNAKRDIRLWLLLSKYVDINNDEKKEIAKKPSAKKPAKKPAAKKTAKKIEKKHESESESGSDSD